MLASWENLDRKLIKLARRNFEDVLRDFRVVQDSVIECMVEPCPLYAVLTDDYDATEAECAVFKEEFLEYGYDVDLTPERRPDDKDGEIIGTRITINRFVVPVQKSEACYEPTEWMNRCEAYTYTFLRKEINKRINEGQKRSEVNRFTVRLPVCHPFFDSLDDYDRSSRSAKSLKYVSQLTSKPLFWMSVLSPYSVEFERRRGFSIRLKRRYENLDIYNVSGPILFSSLMCVKRVHDETKVHWVNLPSDVIRKIMVYLLGTRKQALRLKKRIIVL